MKELQEITKEEFDQITDVVKSILVDKTDGIKYFKEAS